MHLLVLLFLAQEALFLGPLAAATLALGAPVSGQPASAPPLEGHLVQMIYLNVPLFVLSPKTLSN